MMMLDNSSRFVFLLIFIQIFSYFVLHENLRASLRSDAQKPDDLIDGADRGANLYSSWQGLYYGLYLYKETLQ